MPLDDITLTMDQMPERNDAVHAFLADADERVERFLRSQRHDEPITGFVTSDFVMVYHALAEVIDRRLATGGRFCEWGCGFGVVAGLAALLGQDACGIEAHRGLAEAARELMEDHHLDVPIAHGSMIPDGGDALVDELAQQAWLRTGETPGYEELDTDAEDFDLFFAYPWPGEEELIDALFEKFAASGALLLTYHGLNDMRLQRKV